MSAETPERRRWWNWPWRCLTGLVLALGREPQSRAHHLWRDFMPALCLLLLAIMYIGLQQKVDANTVNAKLAKARAAGAAREARAQGQGRKVAVAVTCGALRGVQDAGRMVLTGTLPGTPRTPGTARERALRRVYARAYNRVITAAILDEAGQKGAEVAEGNGSVDCKRLRELAAVP